MKIICLINKINNNKYMIYNIKLNNRNKNLIINRNYINNKKMIFKIKLNYKNKSI